MKGIRWKLSEALRRLANWIHHPGLMAIAGRPGEFFDTTNQNIVRLTEQPQLPRSAAQLRLVAPQKRAPTVVFEGYEGGRPMRIVVTPKEPMGLPVTDATMGKSPPPQQWHDVCSVTVERGSADAAGSQRWIEDGYRSMSYSLNALERYLCYELAKALDTLPEWAIPDRVEDDSEERTD